MQPSVPQPSPQPLKPVKYPALPVLLPPLLLAVLLTIDLAKSLPGGPIMSIHGELAPILICVSMIMWAWPSMLQGWWLRRVAVAVLLLIYAAFTICIISGMIDTWRWTWPRTRFFGW